MDCLQPYQGRPSLPCTEWPLRFRPAQLEGREQCPQTLGPNHLKLCQEQSVARGKLSPGHTVAMFEFRPLVIEVDIPPFMPICILEKASLPRFILKTMLKCILEVLLSFRGVATAETLGGPCVVMTTSQKL